MIELWNRFKTKEIEMRQNGRYIEFYKRNSRIMFKIDLADDCKIVKITRATDEADSYNSRSFNNFFDAKIVTNDNKLASMFQYAEFVCNTNQSSVTLHDILYRFRVPAVKNFEKWLAIGTEFDKRGWGWGNEDHDRQSSINFEPSNVSRAIRNYISHKTWKIDELNHLCHQFSGQTENLDLINKIFEELTDHPEYQDCFNYVLIGGDSGIINRFNSNTIERITRLVKEFNLEIPRLMYYMNYLYNVEGVCLAGELDKYEEYLKRELEKNDGRRNRMYKFPRYFMSAVYTHQQHVARQQLADQMEIDDDYVYQNEYLEYEDDEFKFIIPHSPADVRNEARQQGHCLERRFMSYLASGDTGVVFMRRKDELEKALITIEVRNKRVRQMCIGDNNRIPDEYRDNIYRWAEQVGVTIDNNSWSTRLDV